MKIHSTIFGIILLLALALAGTSAEAARRMGAGKSLGKQSANVTQREATSGGANSTANSTARPATPATSPAAAQPARKPWGAMLGGLAAGLGLAWLASALGMDGVLGQLLVFALLAMAIMLAIGFIMRRLKGGPSNATGVSHGQSPYAMQGAGSGMPGARQAAAPSLKQYSPENVGNDASARPWERSTFTFDAAKYDTSSPPAGSIIGSALPRSQSWGVPADFDAEGFLKASKANFVTLQAAWDRADIPRLRSMMTDDMLAQIKVQLAERESHTGGGANQTDVVMLEAQLLGIEELDEGYLASVEFSGMIREDMSAGPSPFREVWNMAKPRDGSSGWLVAGVQALR